MCSRIRVCVSVRCGGRRSDMAKKTCEWVNVYVSVMWFDMCDFDVEGIGFTSSIHAVTLLPCTFQPNCSPLFISFTPSLRPLPLLLLWHICHLTEDKFTKINNLLNVYAYFFTLYSYLYHNLYHYLSLSEPLTSTRRLYGKLRKGLLLVPRVKERAETQKPQLQGLKLQKPFHFPTI